MHCVIAASRARANKLQLTTRHLDFSSSFFQQFHGIVIPVYGKAPEEIQNPQPWHGQEGAQWPLQDHHLMDGHAEFGSRQLG